MNTMNRPLHILIIEDEQDVCKRFKDEIDEHEDITLIGFTNNSYDALELVQKDAPDAIILDLELHYGKGNGLLFLKELKNLHLPFSPYILITTNNSSPTTYQYTRENGADFIMYKHQDDYSETKVIEFLRTISSVIFSNQKHQNPLHATKETPTQKKQRFKHLISKELDYVGINPKFLGYKYLIDAILMVAEDTSSNITVIIAQTYGKSPSSVERNMQNAINHAWNTMDIDELLLHYTARIRSSKGVPTINEFVYYYANKLKNEP